MILAAHSAQRLFRRGDLGFGDAQRYLPGVNFLHRHAARTKPAMTRLGAPCSNSISSLLPSTARTVP